MAPVNVGGPVSLVVAAAGLVSIPFLKHAVEKVKLNAILTERLRGPRLHVLQPLPSPPT